MVRLAIGGVIAPCPHGEIMYFGLYSSLFHGESDHADMLAAQKMVAHGINFNLNWIPSPTAPRANLAPRPSRDYQDVVQCMAEIGLRVGVFDPARLRGAILRGRQGERELATHNLVGAICLPGAPTYPGVAARLLSHEWPDDPQSIRELNSVLETCYATCLRAGATHPLPVIYYRAARNVDYIASVGHVVHVALNRGNGDDLGLLYHGPLGAVETMRTRWECRGETHLLAVHLNVPVTETDPHKINDALQPIFPLLPWAVMVRVCTPPTAEDPKGGKGIEPTEGHLKAMRFVAERMPRLCTIAGPG